MDPTVVGQVEPPWITKLRRAYEHIAALGAEVDRLSRSDLYGVDVEAMPRAWIVRMRMPEDPAPRLAAIVGDALHNARSALDCLVYVASETHQQRELTEAEQESVKFPIAPNETTFDRRAKTWLALVHDDVRDAVRARQPFALPPGVEFTATQADEELRHHPLAELARLNNLDKHRRLNLSEWVPRDLFVSYPADVAVHFQWAPGPWVHGSEIGRWVLDEGGDEVELHPQGDVRLVLRQHVERGWTNVDVVGFLKYLVTQVEVVVVPPIVRAMEAAERSRGDT